MPVPELSRAGAPAGRRCFSCSLRTAAFEADSRGLRSLLEAMFGPARNLTPWNGSRRVLLVLVLVSAGFGLGGCGSGTDEQISAATKAPPPASEFPSSSGQTWTEFVATAPKDPQIVVEPAGRTYEPGRNRFSFGVFRVDRSEISDAEVAIYVARDSDDVLEGPFPARRESLQTKAPFKSQTVSSDPLAATVAYVSEVRFDKPGSWHVIAIVKEGDEFVPSLMPDIKIGSYSRIPDVGDRAPKVHTPTAADVGGDLTKIDTRQPPDSMHDIDFADVVGTKPTVLLFSTPALCMSRVCGPMVDIEEQVKSETDGDVAFIHQEVYNDNDPNKGIRPQLAAYGLQTEPWLFVIDREGRISTRIEGAFSVADLKDAVAEARG